MSMLDWAKKEIEIACKKENPNRKEGEWDYGCACYESALKAFESLLEDGHSGTSICFTKQILNRLIDGEPLTPIEDTEDVWNLCTYQLKDYEEYQCTRMSSLFKKVYHDGTIKYSDANRVIGIDIRNGVSYNMGFLSSIVDEKYPIKMPYDPEQYLVYTEDCLYDPKNGDFDTIHVVKIKLPNGEFEIVNRYFKEDDNSTGLIEISEAEYFERYAKRVGKKLKEKNNDE